MTPLRGFAAFVRRRRRALPAAAVGLFLLALAPFRASAAPGPADPGDSLGARVGYWGALPAPGDSSAVGRFHNNRLPVWEGAVVYPWRVVTFPVKLVVRGLGAGVVALDEGGAIRTLARLIAPPPTLIGFSPLASAGGAAGVGLGGAVYDKHFLGAGNEAQIRYEGTLRGAHKTSVGLRLGRAERRDERRHGIRRRDELDLIVGYRYRPYTRFFGLGPDTRPADQSIYTQETGWLGAAYRHHLTGGLVGEAEIIGSQILAGGTDFELREGEHYLPEVFGAELPPGYRRASRGTTVALSLTQDNTSETGRPERGGFRRATASWFESLGDLDADFWTFRLEGQQFLPLWWSKRVLALRGVISYIDPTGSDPVPFQRLSYNDNPDLLRGYREYRWRDRGMAILSAEYRWPIWADRVIDGPGLDMYLLTDVGQVFGNFHELTLPNLTVSYGGGLRLIGGAGGLALRLELARSREETQIRFRADQVFQFMKEGLFHGRNPIPSR